MESCGGGFSELSIECGAGRGGVTVIPCGTPLTESAPAGTESRSFAVRETLFLRLPAGWKTLRGKHLRKQRICGTIGFVEAIFKIASYGGVAQLGEHHVRNVGVMGSNPTVSISIKSRKYVVSHVEMRFAGFLLPKNGVQITTASSILIKFPSMSALVSAQISDRLSVPNAAKRIAISKSRFFTTLKSFLYSHLRDNRAPVFSAREGSGFAKDKTIRLLNELIADEMIRKTGNGRGTKYLIKC